MIRYTIISIVSGVLFGFMDGLVNANPLARKLMAVFKPIARTTVNVPAGVIIDIVYGFAMAGVFILLYKSMPGATGLMKGLSFALILWFFRTVMYSASQWMIINISWQTVAYLLITGLLEMAVLGVLYGLTLKPR